MTNVTYQVVLQVIEAFAAQHLQIKRFHSDFPDNIPDFSNDKEDFPILFVSPTNSIFQENTNIFNIRVYCFDLITEGRENINTILSDTHSVLSDLQVYLRDGNIPAIDLLQSSNLTPLNNQLLDYAAGWYVDIQLEVSTSDLCSIPFTNPPIITSSICNSVVFNAFVPSTRQLTINNQTYDLSEDRTWVIFSGNSSQFVKGDGSLDNTLYEPTANKQNSMAIDGFGIKFPTVDAVNNLVNNVARATLQTGFLVNDDAFTLYAFDEFTLGISGSSVGILFEDLLETPPFAPSAAIVQLTSRTVPLSNIGLVDDGNFVKFVGYRQLDDSILFSDNSFHQTPTVCQLGLVLVLHSGGTTTFIDTERTFVNKPDIAAYSNLETTAIGMDCSVTIAPAETNDLHIQNNAGALVGISVNWHGGNNDLLPIPASTASTFTYVSPSVLVNPYPVVTTDLIDPTRYYSGNTLVPLAGNNNASVQRFLMTVKGTIVVQYGEKQYANFGDAKNAIFIESFTDVLPKDSAIEIGRLVTRKSTTNLNDDTQALFVTTGGAGGGSNSATVSWGAITGDINNQTDLVSFVNNKVNLATTGTTNFASKFDSTGLTNSVFYDNTANASVFNSTPTDYGSGFRVLNVGDGTNLPLFKFKGGYNAGNGFEFHQTNTGVVNIGVNGNELAIQIRPAPRILIGTSTDNGTDTLQVNGSALTNRLRYTRATDITTADLDNITTAGFYDGTSLINAPTAGFYYITVERYSSDAVWVHQTATSFGSGNVGNKVYTRVRTSTGWGAWVEMTSQSAVFTGTTNFVAKFASSSALTNSIIFDNGTNVGIGTSTPNPGAKLDVRGLTVFNYTAGGNNNTTYIDNTGAARFYQYDAVGVVKTLIQSNGASYFTGGNVLMGTATDNGADRLQVNGNAHISGSTIINGVGGANTYLQFKNTNINLAIVGSDGAIFGGLATDFGTFVYGSGDYFIATSAAKSLVVKGVTRHILINSTTDNGVDRLQVNGSLIATLIKKSGGTSAQYLMADGSVTTNGTIIAPRFNITGTSYTLLSTDTALRLFTTSSSPTTINITTGLTDNQQYQFNQYGAGQITFSANTGVTLRHKDYETNLSYGQFSRIFLETIGTNEYLLYGDLKTI